MSDRIFAITSTNIEYKILDNIVEKLRQVQGRIYIFTTIDYEPTKIHEDNVELVRFSKELEDNEAAQKNFVLKYFFDNNFKGFLHILEERLEILKDPTIFVDEIEKMMQMLDFSSWFQTRQDEMNYVYTKYNPIARIAIDDDELKKVYDKTICITSHANPLWAIYNYENAVYEDFAYDPQFKVAMYYIIDFLARRRMAGKGWMNAYPSIDEEEGVFKSSNIKIPLKYNLSKQMQDEGIRFGLKKNDISQSDNIEEWMQWFENALMRKIKKENNNE